MRFRIVEQLVRGRIVAWSSPGGMQMRPMIRGRAGMTTVVGTVVALGLLWGSQAQAALVVVSGGALGPERVRIAAGDAVRWENTTAAAQRVESVGEPSFEPLALPALGAGERRFNRSGRYRYRVGGIGKEGEVVVGARVRSPGGRGSLPSSGRGCDRRDVFLYDVRVSAGKSGSETWVPLYKKSGELAFSYTYSARYRRLPVTVKRRCGSDSTIISSPGDSYGNGLHPGSATLTSYIWRDSVVSLNPGHGGGVLPCGFNAAVAGLGARISVQGFVPGSGGGSTLGATSGLTSDQFQALATLLNARHAAVCNKGNPGLSNASCCDGLVGHQAAGTVPIYEKDQRVAGLSVAPPRLGLDGGFTNYSDGSPAALRKLRRGDSFSVSTGQRRYEGTNSQTTAVATTDVRVTFTRRRG